jgi:hypothetical protein
MTSRQVIGPSASRPSQVVRRPRLPRWERGLLLCPVRADSVACLIDVTVQSDLHTDDHFQASYLIDKAVSELCSAQIWQLRNSAAHYRVPAG